MGCAKTWFLIDLLIILNTNYSTTLSISLFFYFSALPLIHIYYLCSHRSTYIHRSKALSSQFSSQLSFLLKLSFNTLVTWCKELTHLKRPWCWERLKAGGEGNDRGWDGSMASQTQWTWVLVNSGCWWRTGRPGVLQSMGSQRVRHDWVTELNWTILLN